MVPEADLALYRLHYDRYQQDSTPHFHTGFHWGYPVPAGAVPSYRCRRHPRVNGRFCFVFTRAGTLTYQVKLRDPPCDWVFPGPRSDMSMHIVGVNSLLRRLGDNAFGHRCRRRRTPTIVEPSTPLGGRSPGDAHACAHTCRTFAVLCADLCILAAAATEGGRCSRSVGRGAAGTAKLLPPILPKAGSTISARLLSLVQVY